MAFREFSRALGRLGPSGRLTPLYPIRPNPLNKAETTIIYDSIKTTPVSSDVQKVSAAGYSTLPPRLKAKMEHFQKNIDKPVYLAGGPADKILYYFTWALVVVGFGMSGEFISHYWWIK